MDPIDELLQLWAQSCRIRAARIVMPSEPPPSAWNEAADSYVRLVGRTQEVEEMSPEVAAALLPRVLCVQPFARALRTKLDVSLLREADDAEVLEELLITQWRGSLEKLWLDP